ncbi:Histone-arginine methyltransferase carm1 [Homalodisca vitripennis]|nr:Histone-arginine methyltransferase carm1 [Homalodisca vitripennis]
MRPTSLGFKHFYKPPKTTYQVLLGKLTTLVQTTKDGIPLPCYCRTIKEQVFSSFLLFFTHSTEQIFPKDADSVNMLPQVTISCNRTKSSIYLVREGQTLPWRKVTVIPFCSFSYLDAACKPFKLRWWNRFPSLLQPILPRRHHNPKGEHVQSIPLNQDANSAVPTAAARPKSGLLKTVGTPPGHSPNDNIQGDEVEAKATDLQQMTQVIFKKTLIHATVLFGYGSVGDRWSELDKEHSPHPAAEVQTCFHGVDLSSMREAAMKEYFRQPIVDTFDMRICMAKSHLQTLTQFLGRCVCPHFIDCCFIVDVFYPSLVAGYDTIDDLVSTFVVVF